MNFLNALQYRHACKIFDENKKISEENQNLIIEFGRLSPSSFGLEPWHFLVISNDKLREQMRGACWNQIQITSSSFIVVFLSYLPHFFRGETEFLKQRLHRRCPEEEKFKFYLNLVMTYLTAQNTEEWAKRQTYLALSNMLTGAASLGIDSCPIEGFEAEKLKPILADYVNWNDLSPVAIAAFGYRLNEQSKKIRENTSSVVTYI